MKFVILPLFISLFLNVSFSQQSDSLIEKSANPELKKPSTTYRTKGYLRILETGFGLGIGEVDGTSGKNTDRFFALKFVNAYQANESISVGIGVGFEKFRAVNTIPITFDLRFYPLKGKVSPTLNLAVGYGFDTKAFKNGIKEGEGLVFHPSVGIKSFVSKRAAFLFHVGYRIQGGNVFVVNGFSAKTVPTYFKFITFNLGISF